MPPKKASSSASKNIARPENPTVLPAVSLRALQPRDGGYWTVTGQCDDTFTLSYFMNGGTEGVAYAMQPCTTEEDVRKYCAEHLYDLAQSDLNPASSQPNLQAGVPLLVPNDFSQNPVHSRNHMSTNQQPYATASFESQGPPLGAHQQVFNLPAPQVTSPASSVFVSEPSPMDIGNQHHDVADLAMLESQNLDEARPFSPTWGFHNEFLASVDGNLAMTDFHGIGEETGEFLAEMENAFTSSMVDEAWTQYEGKDHTWDNMFTNP